MMRSTTIVYCKRVSFLSFARRGILAGTLSSNSSNIIASSAASSSSIRFFADSGASSITYSGGQATEGQGGYYGSGGARHIPPPGLDSQTAARSQLLALAADVQKVHATMMELEKLEQLFLEENSTSSKSMEMRATMKKLMTQHDFLESLNRLEVQGEPVWGLSTAEREMIILARRKVNES